jgi:hypothetical protein
VSDRTFRLTSPLMEGSDIAFFQGALNEQFRAWHVACHIDEDGAYGQKTASTSASSSVRPTRTAAG